MSRKAKMGIIGDNMADLLNQSFAITICIYIHIYIATLETA